ncbi:hypothetical protein [Desulfocicer niacini]
MTQAVTPKDFRQQLEAIPPAGCAGRLGSFVTDADLGDSPLVSEKELCLHKNGKKCLMCVDRCPVGAVSEAGIDRHRCWNRLRSNHTEMNEFKDLEDTTDVCGKCQVLLP